MSSIKIPIQAINGHFILELKDYNPRQGTSISGKKIAVFVENSEGKVSNSHYIPLESIPIYIDAINSLILEN